MEDKRLMIKSKPCYTPVEILNQLRDVHTLIMKHHADNVETGCRIGVLKASRLIHKHTQRRFVHTLKSNVAGIASRHKHGDISPHQEDPLPKAEIACIMAYFQSERNSPAATARMSRRTDGSHITNRRVLYHWLVYQSCPSGHFRMAFLRGEQPVIKHSILGIGTIATYDDERPVLRCSARRCARQND